jgi:hypothetical protein
LASSLTMKRSTLRSMRLSMRLSQSLSQPLLFNGMMMMTNLMICPQLTTKRKKFLHLRLKITLGLSLTGNLKIYLNFSCKAKGLTLYMRLELLSNIVHQLMKPSLSAWTSSVARLWNQATNISTNKSYLMSDKKMI